MSQEDHQKADADSSGDKQFLAEVFPTELEEIGKRQEVVFRRLKSGLQPVDGQPPQQVSSKQSFFQTLRAFCTARPTTPRTRFQGAQPSTRLGLVGLALSGGGIRSATFNLGLLQVLARYGILKQVDYLSTVSGGGFIGSCLSSLLTNRETPPGGKEFPFYHEPGKVESDAMKYLRNSGSYLVPGGFLDKILIPALLLRGILINLLIVFPYIVLAVFLTEWLCGSNLRSVDVGAAYFSDFSKSVNWPTLYWPTQIAALLFLVWVGLYPLIYFLTVAVDSLDWRAQLNRTFAWGLLILGLLAIINSLPPLVVLFRRLDWQDLKTGAAFVISLVPFLFAHKVPAALGSMRGKMLLYACGLLGPLILLLIYLRLSTWMILGDALFDLAPSWATLGAITFAIFIYTRSCVNVNVTSLHGSYRDRLSRAYLFKLDAQGGVILNDEQQLSTLNKENTQAPYHLINVAMNVPNSEDPSLRGRDADFFLMSKNFCGSTRVGFYQTKYLQKADSHLNLGTAMAISGAAAAPNMGTATIKPLVFLLGLLNIRLGYWFPNPYRLRNRGYASLLVLDHQFSPFSGVGPIYLLRELFSKIDEKSRYVNLSDGGHIENLGVYELLRRRCKYIIVGDAEADQNLTFNGLATLMRYAQIDMGIKIEMEFDNVRKKTDGLSRRHCALGKIYYGNGETGHLLYIKSSVTSDEREYIKEYRSRSPQFPHESTADQFFSEEQFEAYRALGYHITGELFQDQGDEVDIAAWMDCLEASLRSRLSMEEKFGEMKEELATIDRLFLDSDLAGYTYQIYPELEEAGHEIRTAKGAAETAERDDESGELYRKAFHLCSLQMRFMEHVIMMLELDKPKNRDHPFARGWMNLFRRWAQSPDFRRCWAATVGNYSLGFQIFCEEALKLRRTIEWQQDGEDALTHRERYYLDEEKKSGRFKSQQISVAGQTVQGCQIWIASMSLKVTPGATGFSSELGDQDGEKQVFRIGFATVCLSQYDSNKPDWEGYQADLMFYRIRDYYRNMQLLEKMIPALREKLQKEFPGLVRFRVDLKTVPDGRRWYSYFFERFGFEVIG